MVINDEKIVNEFFNTPFLSKLIADSGYKSMGVRIVDNDKVIEELTSSYDRKKISLKKGIKNPDFVVCVDHKFLKSLNKENLGWIRRNPVKAYFKYHDRFDIPIFVKLKILSMIKHGS